jgi:hypothetical protein
LCSQEVDYFVQQPIPKFFDILKLIKQDLIASGFKHCGHLSENIEDFLQIQGLPVPLAP